MSWYIEYYDGVSWTRVESKQGLSGGPFSTEAEAEAAVQERTKAFLNNRSCYRIVQQRDTVPAGPEHGIPASDVTAMKGTLPPNPKQAYGDKKVPMHTVPPALMIGAAKAFGEGAVKYGPFNWRDKSVEAMTYVGAIQRHLAAYIDGEDVDPDSLTGKLHLEGIAACVGILLDCFYGGFLLDNRPPKGPAPKLVMVTK